MQIKEAEEPNDIGPAGAVFYQVTLIILKALCEAFLSQIQTSSSVASQAAVSYID